MAQVRGAMLEEGKMFQYAGSILNEVVTSEDKIKKRPAIAASQPARLNTTWNLG